MRRARTEAQLGPGAAPLERENYFHDERMDSYARGRMVVVKLEGETNWQVVRITAPGRKDKGRLLLQVETVGMGGGAPHNLEFDRGPAPTLIEFVAGPGGPPIITDDHSGTRIEIDHRSMYITPDGRVEYNVREEKLDDVGNVVEDQEVRGVSQEFLVAYRDTLELEHRVETLEARLTNILPVHHFQLRKKILELEKNVATAFSHIPDVGEMQTKSRNEISKLRKEISNIHRSSEGILRDFEETITEAQGQVVQHQPGRHEMVHHEETSQEMSERGTFAKDYLEIINDNLKRRKTELDEEKKSRTEQYKDDLTDFKAVTATLNETNRGLNLTDDATHATELANYDADQQSLRIIDGQIKTTRDTLRDRDKQTKRDVERLTRDLDRLEVRENHFAVPLAAAEARRSDAEARLTRASAEVLAAAGDSVWLVAAQAEEVLRRNELTAAEAAIRALPVLPDAERIQLQRVRNELQVINDELDGYRTDIRNYEASAVPLRRPSPRKPVHRVDLPIPPTLAQADEVAYRTDITRVDRQLQSLDDQVYVDLFREMGIQAGDPHADPKIRTLVETIERRRWQLAAKGGTNTETVPAVPGVPAHRDFVGAVDDIASPRAAKNRELLVAVLKEWEKAEALPKRPEVDEKASVFDFEEELGKVEKTIDEVEKMIPSEKGAVKDSYLEVDGELSTVKRMSAEMEEHLGSLNKAKNYPMFVAEAERISGEPFANISDTELQEILQQVRMDSLIYRWQHLHEIEEKIADLKNEEEKGATAREVKGEHLNISSENLRELFAPRMEHVVGAVREMFTSQIDIKMDSEGNPEVPDSILEHFRELFTVADLQAYDENVLRRAGIKDVQEFKNYWDNKLAGETAKMMYQMAQQTLKRELHERTTAMQKLWAVREQVAMRAAITSATLAVNSFAFGEAANWLNNVAGLTGEVGGTVVHDTAIAASGVTSGWGKWKLNKWIFGRKSMQEKMQARLEGALNQDENTGQQVRVPGLKDQQIDNFTNLMITRMFGGDGTAAGGAIDMDLSQQTGSDEEQGFFRRLLRRDVRQSSEFSAGGLTVFTEIIAHTMRSLKGEALKADMGKNEEEPEEAKALTGADAVRYQEYIDRSDKSIDKEGRKQLAMLLHEMRGHGNLIKEEMDAKGKPQKIGVMDKFLAEYSGGGTMKGAIGVNVAMSSLFMLSPEARMAFGALMGGRLGYQVAERMRIASERGDSKRRVNESMRRLRNFRIDFPGYGEEQRRIARGQVVNDYQYLKRLLHANANPEDLAAVVYFIQGPATDKEGKPDIGEDGKQKMTNIPQIDGNLLAQIEGLTFELEEETNVLFEHENERGNMDRTLEELRHNAHTISEERPDTESKTLGKILKKWGIRVAGVGIGAGAGAGAFLLGGFVGRKFMEGMRFTFGIDDTYGGVMQNPVDVTGKVIPGNLADIDIHQGENDLIRGPLRGHWGQQTAKSDYHTSKGQFEEMVKGMTYKGGPEVPVNQGGASGASGTTPDTTPNPADKRWAVYPGTPDARTVSAVDMFAASNGLNSKAEGFLKDLVGHYKSLNNEHDLNEILKASQNTTGRVETTLANRDLTITRLLLEHHEAGNAKEFVDDYLESHGLGDEKLEKAGGLQQLLQDFADGKRGAEKKLLGALHAIEGTNLQEGSDGVKGVDYKTGHDIATKKGAYVFGIDKESNELIVQDKLGEAGGKAQLFTHPETKLGTGTAMKPIGIPVDTEGPNGEHWKMQYYENPAKPGITTDVLVFDSDGHWIAKLTDKGLVMNGSKTVIPTEFTANAVKAGGVATGTEAISGTGRTVGGGSGGGGGDPGLRTAEAVATAPAETGTNLGKIGNTDIILGKGADSELADRVMSSLRNEKIAAERVFINNSDNDMANNASALRDDVDKRIAEFAQNAKDGKLGSYKDVEVKDVDKLAEAYQKGLGKGELAKQAREMVDKVAPISRGVLPTETTSTPEPTPVAPVDSSSPVEKFHNRLIDEVTHLRTSGSSADKLAKGVIRDYEIWQKQNSGIKDDAEVWENFSKTLTPDQKTAVYPADGDGKINVSDHTLKANLGGKEYLLYDKKQTFSVDNEGNLYSAKDDADPIRVKLIVGDDAVPKVVPQ